jgi:hypothetical protein
MTSSYIALKTKPVRCSGIVVGSLDHQILLALRAPGGMTSEQVYERFPRSPSQAICRLRRAGLIVTGGMGKKGEGVSLTPSGRALVDPDGDLARSKTLINYCHL